MYAWRSLGISAAMKLKPFANKFTHFGRGSEALSGSQQRSSFMRRCTGTLGTFLPKCNMSPTCRHGSDKPKPFAFFDWQQGWLEPFRLRRWVRSWYVARNCGGFPFLSARTTSEGERFRKLAVLGDRGWGLGTSGKKRLSNELGEPMARLGKIQSLVGATESILEPFPVHEFRFGRPLPACPAGEEVLWLETAPSTMPRPLPACPAGEGVLWLELRKKSHPFSTIARELLHLPDKPAGVAKKGELSRPR